MNNTDISETDRRSTSLSTVLEPKPLKCIQTENRLLCTQLSKIQN